jgi:hypothetical protein
VKCWVLYYRAEPGRRWRVIQALGECHSEDAQGWAAVLQVKLRRKGKKTAEVRASPVIL